MHLKMGVLGRKKNVELILCVRGDNKVKVTEEQFLNLITKDSDENSVGVPSAIAAFMKSMDDYDYGPVDQMLNSRPYYELLKATERCA